MKTIAIAASLLFAGCAPKADVGVSGRIEVPRDSAGTCTSLCGSIGLTLDSVVVMANNVGCVCRAAPAAPPASTTSAASGGMAAILIQQQQQQQQRQRQQQRK
jgi:hypothetical protein